MAQKATMFGPGSTDERVLAEIGSRLARVRLERNRTQQQLAEEAGVSRSTIKRLEAGESTQLANLIRVLRALGLLANLELLVPEPEVRPLGALEQQRAGRRRATGDRSASGGDDKPGWTWGDER